MSDRSCSTCKHFEPSSVQNKGWCRNPRLYAPQQSHQVRQDVLDCAGRTGNFWEASVGSGMAFGGTDPMNKESSPKPRLRLFQPPPQLIPATAGVFASSTRGGGGGFDDRDSSKSSGRADTGSGGGRGMDPTPPGGSRGKRTGVPQGQERTVSYQPEERYWTDYLRIALPVVGLLLMLGLFWYWASAVIGNDDDNEPKKTPTQVVALITEEAPSPTSTSEINITPENVTPTATEGGSNGGNEPTEEATEEPTEEVADVVGKGFEEGELVVTNTGDVNLRPGKSTEGEPVLVLDEATQLTVIEPGTEEDADGRVWVGVRTEGGDDGFVADEFLDSSE